jgi:hypothetical protein
MMVLALLILRRRVDPDGGTLHRWLSQRDQQHLLECLDGREVRSVEIISPQASILLAIDD